MGWNARTSYSDRAYSGKKQNVGQKWKPVPRGKDVMPPPPPPPPPRAEPEPHQDSSLSSLAQLSPDFSSPGGQKICHWADVMEGTTEDKSEEEDTAEPTTTPRIRSRSNSISTDFSGDGCYAMDTRHTPCQFGEVDCTDYSDLNVWTLDSGASTSFSGEASASCPGVSADGSPCFGTDALPWVWAQPLEGFTEDQVWMSPEVAFPIAADFPALSHDDAVEVARNAAQLHECYIQMNAGLDFWWPPACEMSGDCGQIMPTVEQSSFPSGDWFYDQMDGEFDQYEQWNDHHRKSEKVMDSWHAAWDSRNITRKVHAERDPDEPITTLMIHNIPNLYTGELFVQELDEMGFEGKYNFVHLPVDRGTGRNVAYAFVNFVNEKIGAEAAEKFAGYTFSRFMKQKRANSHAWTSPAHLQGLKKNEEHYRNTSSRPLILLCDNYT